MTPSLKSIIWICLVMAGMRLEITLPAADPSKEKLDFVVVNEPVNIPERGLVIGYCVITTEHRFSFIPPLDWRLESNRSERSVTLTPRALDTAIRIRLLPGQAVSKEDAEADWAGRLIKARYPDAEIKDRFECHTSGLSGVAFDLRQDYGGNLRLDSRVAFVPYEKGTMEVRQTSFAGKLDPSYVELGTLLTSLRVAPRHSDK
jgi:hypothetical protein